MGIEKYFLHEIPSKGWPGVGYYSLLAPTPITLCHPHRSVSNRRHRLCHA